MYNSNPPSPPTNSCDVTPCCVMLYIDAVLQPTSIPTKGRTQRLTIILVQLFLLIAFLAIFFIMLVLHRLLQPLAHTQRKLLSPQSHQPSSRSHPAAVADWRFISPAKRSDFDQTTPQRATPTAELTSTLGDEHHSRSTASHIVTHPPGQPLTLAQQTAIRSAHKGHVEVNHSLVVYNMCQRSHCTNARLHSTDIFHHTCIYIYICTRHQTNADRLSVVPGSMTICSPQCNKERHMATQHIPDNVHSTCEEKSIMPSHIPLCHYH